MELTLGKIAEMTQGDLAGSPDKIIRGAAGLGEAGPDDISFLGNPKYAAQAADSRAGAIFLPRSARSAAQASGAGPKDRVFVDDAQWAFAQVLEVLAQEMEPRLPPQVHPKSEVHYEARLAPGVSLGAFSVVERFASVGEGARIGPLCYVGVNARVGKGCLIYPHVTIRENCVIGDRVIVHSGAVIGSDGYGFSTEPKTGRHRKIPQIGNVVVEDDVEIGSNVSIDRATVGTTLIGAGTKIDNLVQLGHNVRIGRNCLIVSQVGVSGSTQVGHQVILAGQAGLVGHIKIGDGAVVTAQTGVMSDVDPKAILFGSPARPHREAMKLLALYGRLPDMAADLKALKSRIEALESSRGVVA